VLDRGASKNLLLECLETLDHSDDLELEIIAPSSPPLVLDQQKKKRACKASDPVDTTCLRHNTNLNKNSEGFKAKGVIADPVEDMMYVASFDHDAAESVPLSCPRRTCRPLALDS
jgi:hypothetical protein